MERRYLGVILAIMATFATVSSGFKSLQRLSQQHGQRPSTLSHWVAELKTDLYPSHTEGAPVLAEMKLPSAPAQAGGAEQAVQKSQAAAHCARQTAMREAERAQWDALRISERTAREMEIAIAPVSIDLKGLDGLDQRIKVQTAAIARRIAVQDARMQSAARVQAVSWQTQNGGQRGSPCRGRTELR